MPPVDDDHRQNSSAQQPSERPFSIFNRIIVFVASSGLAAIGTYVIYTRSLELKGRQQAPGSGILITGTGAVAIGIAITGIGMLIMAYALCPTHRFWNRKVRGSSNNK